MMSMPVDPVVDAAGGITKSQLLRYYEAVAGLMMPHLEARPVALLRAPEGVGGKTLLLRHQQSPRLPGIGQFRSSLYASRGPLLEVREPRGVVSAVMADVIEFQTFNSTTRHGERPDRLWFSLSPCEGTEWNSLCTAAQHLRDYLLSLGLASWLKTGGDASLHVLVPLSPVQHACETLRDLAFALAHRMAEEQPSSFVTPGASHASAGRVIIDPLGNNPAATCVAAWSARARAGLPVSVPLAWEELADSPRAPQWTVRDVDERLQVGNQPWTGYWAQRQDLHQALQQLPIHA